MVLAQNINVLVIDINPQMRKLWQEALAAEGYSIKSASTVEEGLRLIGQGKDMCF
jgi:CheY-like chemotaxis protein